MRFKALLLACAITVFAAGAGAQDITGTILIKKKLTQPQRDRHCFCLSARHGGEAWQRCRGRSAGL